LHELREIALGFIEHDANRLVLWHNPLNDNIKALPFKVQTLFEEVLILDLH
jgi:hypothetical protein